MEVCKIAPPDSPTDSSLPLTFLDAFWFKFHPVERIFFYELTADSSSFYSSILPTLKQSLSLTLLHFLPFSGNLIWPEHSDKPFILYTPGDGVSLTVAESYADFDTLSGDSICEIPDSHQYVPELDVSETKAATMCFQITYFPNKGFSIGISSHHAIFDGKSIILFLKSWAHMCKHFEIDNGNPILPPELTPFLDRTLIQDPDGLETAFLNYWINMASLSGNNPRSLKLFPTRSTTDTNFVRGTFQLSGEDIKKIRQKALFCQNITESEDAKPKRYSTFVLVYSYVSVTIIKAKAAESEKRLILGLAADVRARLDPPVPSNYFGNCIFPKLVETQVELAIKEDGLGFIAEELRKAVKELEKGALDGAKEKIDIFDKFDRSSIEVIGIAGSPRFEVYGTDFGWGKPKKVEVTSIDRSTSISIAERRDGNGGIEVGIVFKKDEMEMFKSLFLDGLHNDL